MLTSPGYSAQFSIPLRAAGGQATDEKLLHCRWHLITSGLSLPANAVRTDSVDLRRNAVGVRSAIHWYRRRTDGRRLIEKTLGSRPGPRGRQRTDRKAICSAIDRRDRRWSQPTNFGPRSARSSTGTSTHPV